jgi:hypothetical protein
MAEIIWTKTIVDRKPLLNQGTGQVSLDTKYTIWQGPVKVGVAVSVLRSGLTRKTNKRWYKWGTQDAYGFRRTSLGNVMPYRAARAASMRVEDLWKPLPPGIVFDLLDGEVPPWSKEIDEIGEVFSKAVTQTFGVKAMSDIYPLADYYGITKYNGIPGNLRPGFRLNSPNEAAVRWFGKKRITPDWVKTLSREDALYISAIAEQARGLAFDKDVLGFLKSNVLDEEMEENVSYTPYLRHVFKTIGTTGVRNLLHRTLDAQDVKRITYLTQPGANNDYAMKRLRNNPFVITNWDELLDIATGIRI